MVLPAQSVRIIGLLTLIVLLPSLEPVAFGQSATASLSGTAVDETHAVMPQVNITITNSNTGGQRRVGTNAQGYFFAPSLPPGTYDLTAERDGFARVELRSVLLKVGDQIAVTLQMKVGEVTQSVFVQGGGVASGTSPAISTVVDREFLETLPLNGRSLHALLELTPGTALVKRANASQGLGQFSVDGQRDNANYFTVDGVGANVGVTAGPSLGATAGGTVPAFSALGSSTSLVSVDDVEEFRMGTSTYAAEFGRTPGGQISIVTRSGTDAFYGGLFEYFRHDALDANDWFANSLGLAKPPLRQNDFGGVMGGPIVKDRSFYFLTYEGLRLRQPRVDITPVPTLSSRQNAPAAIQPFLKAFPLPNGQMLGNELAEFSASYSNDSTSNATSVRLDQTFSGTLTIFGRVSDARSEAAPRGAEGIFNALSVVSPTQIDTLTVTIGATQVLRPTLTNEIRVNFSRSRGANSFELDDFGGAERPADSVLFPAFVTRTDALMGFAMSGGPAGFIDGQNVENFQRQFNLIDSVSLMVRAHQMKLGVDYRRLGSELGVLKYGQSAFFTDGAAGALTGQAAFVGIQSNPYGRFPLFNNFSAYVQDAWSVGSRFTLTSGLRWDVNPPPSERYGNQAYTVIGLENPLTMTLAPKGTPLWKTRFDGWAPRVGGAYRLEQGSGHESVLRGGFGVFYDLGTGPIGSGFAQGAFPYWSGKFLSNTPFPLDPIQAQPAPIRLTPPYGNLVVADPHLALPRVYEWNVALEKTLALDQVASISYVGAADRRLLRGEMLTDVNPDFTTVSVVRNTASSDYRALQFQYRRRLSRGFQALASYTWARSLDNASDETFGHVPVALIDSRNDRGPSDFDIRHAFSAAATYQLPVASSRGVAGLLRDWSVDAVVRARSAAPVNIVADRPVLFGVREAARPDSLPGVPVYIDDPTAPGGWRINAAAFSTPPSGRQGTLGRNALRGFPVSQIDMSLRRRLAVKESRLEFRVDVFNLFNHPNFADPNGFMADALFGQSQEMFGQSLGGLNPLYQIGGARSVQLGLRMTF
jgi:hypothetical protein